MLDGNNCSHPISHISPGKIRIFFLQNTKLSGILVDHSCKGGLKSGQMSSALTVINIVTESENIFVEFIHILKGCFNLDTV